MEYGFKRWQPPSVQRGHLNVGGRSPQGGSIDVTSMYFTRDEKPWIGVMGEFHYSRCSQSEWRDRLEKMKAGGITIVSTYIFWIYHEEEEGVVDFSGDNDIRGFVQKCQILGLDVILRPGPWCHAECRNGGFPDWLLKKDYKLRDVNQPYLERVKVWFETIAQQVKGLFYRDGGNIIGVQLENESVTDAEYLRKLKEIAIESGMIVPLYTVTGWNSVNGAKIPVDEVVPVFGGYCDAPWEESLKRLEPSVHYFFNQMRNDTGIGNDLLPIQQGDDEWVLPYERYPFATCELGGGLQVTHHRRYQIKGMDIYALSLVKLGVGNNLIGYYMYCGGTNKTGKNSTFQESTITGYNNDYPILSYDFQAPISEYGEIREQYRLLNLLHLFVQDFGTIIAPMTAVDAEVSVGRHDRKSLRYGMRTDGTGGFVFVNHYERLSVLEDIHDVVINTGGVTFPSMDVCGDISFFLPFHLELKGLLLEYATAQPICQNENTFFFAEIPGIGAVYRVNGMDYKAEAGLHHALQIQNITIVTLTWEEAGHIRRLADGIYVGEACDLYLNADTICAVQPGSFRYAKWNQEICSFERYEVEKTFRQPCVTWENVGKPEFEMPYLYELNMGGGRKIAWKKIMVSSPDGMAEIPVPPCDAMQMYVDGTLVADDYYCAKPWRIPADDLYGKTCFLGYSELRDDCYREENEDDRR